MSGSPAAASNVGSMSWCDNAVQHRACLDLARPTEETRNAPRAFPVGVLLAAEWRIGAIRPGVVLRAVIGGIHNDGVIGDAELDRPYPASCRFARRG